MTDVDPLGLCKEQTLPNMGERAAGDNVGSMLRGKVKGNAASSKTVMSFEEALEDLNKSNLRPGQTEISRSRVMEIVENYDPVKANSSVYSNGTTSFVIEGHHTTVANTMLGRGGSFNMNTPTTQLPSATNVYWTKKWYEIWKKSIKY